MIEVGNAEWDSLRNPCGILDDPRTPINIFHSVENIVAISLAAIIAGAEGPKSIARWAQNKPDWLKTWLVLPEGRTPSRDCIRTFFARVDPTAFQACFFAWLDGLAGSPKHSDGLLIVAIDGQALRHSFDTSNSLRPLHPVSAWVAEYHISLGPVATEENSNEITAIPELLDQIDIEDTIDAMGCQKNIAAKIIDKGGDYLLALKGNQGTLYQAAMDWVIEQMEHDFSTTTVEKYVESTQGHGREDTVECFHLTIPKTLPGASLWKELRTIGVAVRTSLQGGKESTDIRFFMSSLNLGVRRFAAAGRGH